MINEAGGGLCGVIGSGNEDLGNEGRGKEGQCSGKDLK